MLKQVPVAGGFALALGLFGGCAASEPTTMATPTAAAAALTHEAIISDLNRLRALDVVEVGNLILGLPAQATSCYNLPCPGWTDQVARAEAEREPRLAQFVAHAAAASASATAAGAASATAVAADLDHLRALQIVEVQALLVTMPANNPNCYNLPCADDKARAEAANNMRAARLAAIASATSND